MGKAMASRHALQACAGQQCPDRERCVRYMRTAGQPYQDALTGRVVAQAWASFDIERMAMGDCKSMLPMGGNVVKTW